MIPGKHNQPETPSEEIKGDRYRRDGSSGESIGPKSVFMSGFDKDECATVADILTGCGYPDHRIVLCTKSMLTMTLEDALCENPEEDPVPRNALPRTIIISGVPDYSIRNILESYRSTPLSSPIWATTTESNLRMSVRSVLRHLLEEHNRISSNGSTV